MNLGVIEYGRQPLPGGGRIPDALEAVSEPTDLGQRVRPRRLGQAGKLAFIDAFCGEIMRLKLVAPPHVVERVCDVDFIGCMVPKGKPVMMLVRWMATRDERFDDALRCPSLARRGGGEGRCA